MTLLVRNESLVVKCVAEHDPTKAAACDRYGRLLTSPVSGGGVTYNATPPTVADGGSVTFQGDAAGNLKVYLASLISGEDTTNNAIGTVRKYPVVSTYAPSISTSFGTALTANAKATPGLLKGFTVSSINAAIRYFQIFNTTGATTPVLMSFAISAGSATAATTISVGEDILGANGYYCSTGISWGLSTTKDSYVAATATDHQVHLIYY